VSLESVLRIVCATTTVMSALVWFVARRTRPVRDARLAFIALGAALWIEASLFVGANRIADGVGPAAMGVRVLATCVLFVALGFEVRRRRGRSRLVLRIMTWVIGLSFVADTVLHRAQPPFLTFGTPALALLSWTLVVLLLQELLDTDRAEASLAVAMRERSAALHRTQSELVEAEKLASVGLVAAGVAHEINNPAAYAVANLAGLRESLLALRAQRLAFLPRTPDGAEVIARAAEADAVADEQLRDALDGLLRIRDIVAELNSLAQRGPVDPEPVDLPRVVEAGVALARPTVRRRADLTLSLEPVPPVLGRDGKLSQVVINLLVNAAEAIPDRGMRRGRIEVRTTTLDGLVVLEVRDDGEGIPPEQLGEIFRPLYTTKRAGTGLGLAISRRIVEAHGGRVEVESVVGEGSTFRVLLPAATDLHRADETRAAPPTSRPPPRLDEPKPASTPPARTSPPQPPAPQAHDAARPLVLLVDDEALLVKILARFLARSHRVVTAGSADEALTLLRNGTMPDLLVCDLVMPGKTGADFYEALAQEHPTLVARTTFISGGGADAQLDAFRRRVDRPILHKPLEPEELVAHLAAELQARREIAPNPTTNPMISIT
jgi:signal transduction histidine kinase/ActR/RegA family two-component response regulator